MLDDKSGSEAGCSEACIGMRVVLAAKLCFSSNHSGSEDASMKEHRKLNLVVNLEGIRQKNVHTCISTNSCS